MHTQELLFNGGMIRLGHSVECLWQLIPEKGGTPVNVAPPVIELDNRLITGAVESFQTQPRKLLRLPDVTEWVCEGSVQGEKELTLRIIFRLSDQSPVVRYYYEILSARKRFMTGAFGKSPLRYQALDLSRYEKLTEVRLSDFNEMYHSYCPTEFNLTDQYFDIGYHAMGPILVAESGTEALLTAYEHGSTYPDAFLAYELAPDRLASLCPVKGNWPIGRSISEGHSFQSPWFEIALIQGDIDDIASVWRAFVLNHLSENAESRKPYIFYNTWAKQERSKWWHRKPYLAPMNETDVLHEIDIAHRMGIEVFVLDAGWFEKTGDWIPSTERFPNGLKPIREKLEQCGMKLGLWFNPLMVACTSQILEEHRDCVRSWRGVPSKPQPVWETEDSVQMCLVSRYRDTFADNLIRLAKEEGVRYFKWDAIDQYGCDDPNHAHGDAGNTPEERAENHAFELIRSMSYVVDRLCQEIPDAIVDFDVTEPGRAVGLGFLSSGKYFLINNGPYFHNLDIPYDPANENCNAFFFPGQARSRVCRIPLSYDRWLPSALFLCHYLPDLPTHSQWASVASLILGHHGIWGDLSDMTSEGIELFGTVLGLYKQIREDITLADPVVAGQTGGNMEVHEKINPKTGRGVVCVFSGSRGEYQWMTSKSVAEGWYGNEGVRVEYLQNGHARIHVTFREAGACLVLFGVDDSQLN